MHTRPTCSQGGASFKKNMDLNKSFGKLLERISPRYRGVLLEVVDNGYVLWERHFDTLDDVDVYLDQGCERIAKSVMASSNK